MKIIKGDILDIKKGIIIQQVNCQNAYGAGLSGAIAKKYPSVKQEYHKICNAWDKNYLFGKYQCVHVTDKLSIINLFSQFNYGNPKRTGLIYTDVNKLINGIKVIANPSTQVALTGKHQKVYIPAYIGCGLGGADWNEVLKMLTPLDITIISIN